MLKEPPCEKRFEMLIWSFMNIYDFVASILYWLRAHMFRIAIAKLFVCPFSRELASHRGGSGSIPGRDMSVLVRMRSSLVDRESDCQCTNYNGPGFDPSLRRHSEI